MPAFPAVTVTTGGALLMIKKLLGLATSRARGRADTWIGTGDGALQRAARRHGNLAENAGFVAGFTLMELSGRRPTLLFPRAARVALRLLHAAGLSQADTSNVLRLIGGARTYLLGLVLGTALAWIGVATPFVTEGVRR